MTPIVAIIRELCCENTNLLLAYENDETGGMVDMQISRLGSVGQRFWVLGSLVLLIGATLYP